MSYRVLFAFSLWTEFMEVSQFHMDSFWFSLIFMFVPILFLLNLEGCSVPGFHSPLLRDHPHLEVKKVLQLHPLCMRCSFALFPTTDPPKCGDKFLSRLAKDMLTMMWFETGGHWHPKNALLVVKQFLDPVATYSISSSAMLLVSERHAVFLSATHPLWWMYTNYDKLDTN